MHRKVEVVLRPPRERMAVVAVGGDDVISRIEAGERRNTGGFLPDIRMVVPGEVALLVQSDQGLLEMPDE